MHHNKYNWDYWQLHDNSMNNYLKGILILVFWAGVFVIERSQVDRIECWRLIVGINDQLWVWTMVNLIWLITSKKWRAINSGCGDSPRARESSLIKYRTGWNAPHYWQFMSGQFCTVLYCAVLRVSTQLWQTNQNSCWSSPCPPPGRAGCCFRMIFSPLCCKII